MTIVIVVAAYILVVGLFVRLVQFSHQRDEAMHSMTAEWIEESMHS